MGNNKVNIYDLARETGYSSSTISKALNNTGRISETTRKKIISKAKELDYVADYNAKVLSSKKTWLIGIIYADNMGVGFSHPFFSQILENFKNEIESEGYEITFINQKLGQNKMSYLDFYRHRNLDGVFVATFGNDDDELRELIESGVPVISVDSGNWEVTSVVSDDIKGARLAAKYLLNLGHEYICHIAGPLYAVSSQKRIQGFEEVLQEAGNRYLVVVADDFTYEGGYKQAKAISQRVRKPTAVFVSSDWMALGAIKAFQENSLRVPEDISVIGYDNIEFLKYSTPALTTIAQDVKKIGKEAANSLIDLINGKNVKTKKLDVKLVERETCIPFSK